MGIIKADVFQLNQGVFDGIQVVDHAELLADVIAAVIIHKAAELVIGEQVGNGMEQLIEGGVVGMLKEHEGVAAAGFVFLANQIAGIEILQAAKGKRHHQQQKKERAEIAQQTFSV